jgi:hypothetical protein
LREENRVLKEHMDGHHLRLPDAQRRRLAMNAIASAEGSA